MSDPTIQVLPKGPYLVAGKVTLLDASGNRIESGRENSSLPLRRFHQQTVLRRNPFEDRFRRGSRGCPAKRGIVDPNKPKGALDAPLRLVQGEGIIRRPAACCAPALESASRGGRSFRRARWRKTLSESPW